jgi:hypothetical protein
MRLFSFILALVFFSCNSKEYSLEKLAAAKWEELEPGIGFIKTRGGKIGQNDSVAFTSVGASVSGLLIKPEDGEQREQMNSINGLLYKIKDQLPCREGFLRVDFKKILTHQNPEVVVYLKDPVDSITVMNELDWIRTLPGVETVEFISKEMAAKKFSADNGDEWSRIIAENPLPESYDITIKKNYMDSDSIVQLKSAIEQRIPNVDEVQHPALFKGKEKIFCYVLFKAL